MSNCTPDSGGSVGVIGSALAIGVAAQCHYVMPPLQCDHANDALDAVADEVASHFRALLAFSHQLLPVTHDKASCI